MAIERTFSIIKPDAVARNAIGPITAKLEAAGLRVVASKMVRLTEAQAQLRVARFSDDTLCLESATDAAAGCYRRAP